MTNIEKKGYHPVTIRIYTKDKELLLEDKLICAYNTKSGAIISVGKEGMAYVQEDEVAVINPLKWGNVADYVIFEKVIMHYKKKLPVKFAKKPKVALCIPARLTEVEKKAFSEAFIQCTGKPFWLIEKSFEEMSEGESDIQMKGINYYVEFVSEYYNTEYFN